MLITLEWINYLIQSMLFGFFVSSVAQNKKGPLFTVSGLMIASALGYILTYSFKDNVNFKIPILLTILIGCIFVVSTDKLKKKIFISTLFIVFMFSSEILATFLFLAIVKDTDLLTFEPSVIRIIGILLFNFIYYSLTMIFALAYHKVKGKALFLMISLLIIFPVSQMIFMVGLFYNNFENLNANFLFFATVTMFVSLFADVLMIKVIQSAVSWGEKKREYDFIKTQNEQVYKYYLLATENSEKIAKLKHDVANQIEVAQALFSSKNEDDKRTAVKLAGEIIKQNEDVDNFSFCENKVANTILILKSKEAKELGISTDVNALVKANTEISDFDICSLFSNLYENAIEACKKIKNMERNITIRAGEKQGYFIVKFINTSENKPKIKDNYIQTNKEDKSSHGYGLKSIKNIAKKYNGEVSINIYDNLFEITVTMKIH